MSRSKLNYDYAISKFTENNFHFLYLSQQWLHGARTCPVCRHRVRISSHSNRTSEASNAAGPSSTGHENHHDDDDDDSDVDFMGDILPGFD